MQFEWDQAKSDACFLERGFDFAYAASAFADPNRIVRQDTRHVYGETRYQLIGRIDNRVFCFGVHATGRRDPNHLSSQSEFPRGGPL